jgi:flagellar hook-associated protein 2
MYSTVSFTGLASGLDTAAIVEQLVAIRRQPITRLQERRSLFESQKKALDELKSKLLALQKAAQSLDTSNEFAALQATSSAEDLLTVTAGSDAASGSYDIVINSRAVAQKEISQGYDSADEGVGEGTISFTVDGETTELELTGFTSLESLRASINDNVEGVSAAIIYDGSETGGYRLVLSGVDAGTAGAFSYDLSGLSGGITPAFTSQQAAADASLTIDGIAVTARSNVVTTAISGLTLNLEGADPGQTVHVEVGFDSEAMYEQVKTFVDAYNDVMTFINDQNDTDGTLYDSPTLRSVQGRIEGLLTTSHDGDGAISLFAQLGITRGEQRLYDFDKQEFLDALAAHYGSVRDFFVYREGNSGKAYLMDQAIDVMTDSVDGVFKYGRSSLDARIDTIDDTIARYERSVDSYRTTLERKFLAMESMLAQLQAQGNYLTSFGF